MNKTEPRTLAGFMELMPNEQILFEQIKQKIEKTYQKFGFLPLDTPILELSEVLLAKAGGETEKQIYRFEKGDTDISMRFDLTVPLAKYVAKNYGNLSFPFRRYQIGKVYRGERTQKGRFREFYQCDIDIIGDGELSVINDAELPSVIYNIFKELGFDDLLGGISLIDVLRRPGVEFNKMREYIPELTQFDLSEIGISQLEIMVKYEGYIEKQKKEAQKLAKLEEMKLPLDIDYLHMDGLALEARQKLDKVKPISIGQASRISGVNPADISMLILHLKKEHK